MLRKCLNFLHFEAYENNAYKKFECIHTWLAVEAEKLGDGGVEQAEGDGDPVFGCQHFVNVGVGGLVVVGRVAPELELVIEGHVEGVEQVLGLAPRIPIAIL